MKNIENLTNDIIREIEAILGTGYKVTETDVPKNNGIIRKAICIRKEDSNIGDNHYLDVYEDLEGAEEIAKAIVAAHVSSKADTLLEPSVDMFRNTRWILVNRASNAKMEQEYICEPYLDLLKVLVAELSVNDTTRGIVKISHSLADSMELDVAELKKTADERLEENLLLLPFECWTPFCDDTYDAKFVEASLKWHETEANDTFMMIMSNKEMHQGAAAILKAHKLLARFGRDCYIIPSSVHEVLVFTINEDSKAEEFKDFIPEVNKEKVEAWDVLSNNLYHYDHVTGEVTIVE